MLSCRLVATSPRVLRQRWLCGADDVFVAAGCVEPAGCEAGGGEDGGGCDAGGGGAAGRYAPAGGE